MYHHQFRNRTLELLDADDIPSADLYQNLKELDFINTYLGGHAITIAGVKQIIAAHPEKKRGLCWILHVVVATTSTR
ncbi:MAG: hypothetical protein HC892_13885 [Saprospiraceae bacterium]|nr:hypothetical protein [Saprospiraceae bacterium]